MKKPHRATPGNAKDAGTKGTKLAKAGQAEALAGSASLGMIAVPIAQPSRPKPAKAKKPRRRCDTESDWLTPRRETRPEAPPEAMELTTANLRAFFGGQKKADKALFAGKIDWLRENANRSKVWLNARGWECVGGDEVVGFTWRKKNGNGSFAWSGKKSDSTALEKCSFELYACSETAARWAERGDVNRAIHFAWLAGWNSGLSHARFRQVKMKQKLTGRKPTPERAEAMHRLAALEIRMGTAQFARLKRYALDKLDPWFPEKFVKEQTQSLLRSYRRKRVEGIG